jgi:hypothetical protein
MLWHVAGEFVQDVLEKHAKATGVDREWFPVQGGTTVSLRAIPMLAMLGFRRIHVYGLDSCYRDKQHHAYAQAENDSDRCMEMFIDGRSFWCAPWHIKQAHEFQELMRYVLVPAGVELAIHGDGMIAAILDTAATAANEE